MQYYKGFIPTKNKKSLMTFKNADTLLDEASVATLPEYAGVLAEDVIMLDFDDLTDANIAMRIISENNLNCKVVKTSRGIHALFRRGEVCKNATGCQLACGLRCDIKCGSRNSYEILKSDSKIRLVVRDSDTPDIIPKYFEPIQGAVSREDINEGNRNQTLFSYILTLTSAGFDNTAARKTIEIINDFVLNEPLPASEIKSITRDEAFDKATPQFFVDSHFKHDIFAKWLRDREHVIKINGVLHYYKDGIYVNGEELLGNKMISILPALTDKQRKEVLSYLRVLIMHDTPEADVRYIAFHNGIWDMIGKSMVPFSPDLVLTNVIPHDFTPNVEANLVDVTLLKLACGDARLRDLLEEVAGYCLFRRNELGKSFFLLGDNNNGKSTYINMLWTMIGVENVAALNMTDFNKTFHCATLLGKLANLGDDIDDLFVAEPSTFKKLCTGDPITVENKYERPFTLLNIAKLLFSANTMPRINDRTGAVARRIIPIPFNAKFSSTDADYDPFIKSKLQSLDCIQRLIVLGLKGLERVLRANAFTTTEAIATELEEINLNNNPLLRFAQEYGEDTIVNHSCESLYLAYRMWTSNRGLNTMCEPNVVKTLCSKYRLKVIKLDNEMVYVRK